MKSLLYTVGVLGLLMLACNINDVRAETVNATLQADARIRGGSYSGNNYGGADSMILKHGSVEYARKAYVRFDISSLGEGQATNATLDFVITRILNTPTTVYLYALNDGDVGESWIEGTRGGSVPSDGSITWDTAPANKLDSGHNVLDNATFIQSISGVSTSSYSYGDTMSFSSEGLARIINEDTDGKITFILTREGGSSSEYLDFATKEHATQDEAKLKVEMDRTPGVYVTARADTYVRGGPYTNTNYGTATTMDLKGTPNPEYCRKTYLGFELPSMENLSLIEAELKIELKTRSVNGLTASTDLNIWGVNDSEGADNWSETAITWDNAPANQTDTEYPLAMDILTDEATLLGTMAISDAPTNSPAQYILSFSTTSLRSFIKDDTDGLVTLIVQSLEDSAVEFQTKEVGLTAMPPTLLLDLEPPAGSVIIIK